MAPTSRGEGDSEAECGSSEGVEGAVTSAAAIRQEMRELQAAIRASNDYCPNLRDYGFDKRGEFEAALVAHHERVEAMATRLDQCHREWLSARIDGRS